MTHKQDVLTFRVDQHHSSGGMESVPVELRGWSITGQVIEGEEVEVYGTWDSGTLRAKRVFSVATGAAVRVARIPRYAKWILAAFAAFFLMIVFSGVRSTQAFHRAADEIEANRPVLDVDRPSAPGDPAASTETEMPDVVGLRLGPATQALFKAGFDVFAMETDGNEFFCNVESQQPAAGERVPLDSHVRLTFPDSEFGFECQ